MELSGFSEADPKVTDLVIAVPANTKSFVFEDGGMRMLRADRSHWPDPVKNYVRFDQ